MASFQVEIVSASASVASYEATAVFARSLEGEIGILPGHQPALLALEYAPVKVEKTDGGVERLAVHQGFLFYSGGDQLVVLANIAEHGDDIDTGRAQARLDELAREDQEEAVVLASVRKQELRLSVAG